MYIGGKWVGYGLGDAAPEVGVFRAKLRKKFSYAKDLPETTALVNGVAVPLFDQAMSDVVTKAQTVYVGQGRYAAVNGLIDYKMQVALGWIIPAPVDKIGSLPLLFTVCGTGVPWWIGPDADLARDIGYDKVTNPNGKYRWQPIGYPAQAIPMGKSISEGKAKFFNQLEIHRAQIEKYGAAFVGYSQGAVIVSEVWEQMKLDQHWAVPFIKKAVTFGNPSRELGKVYPDFAPGQIVAPANTSGVAYPADRVHDTPAWWRDYAHKGDLYAAAEQGASGEDKTAIWRIIRGEKFFVGPDTLLEQVMEISKNPLLAIGAFKAMLDALTFFGKQLTPHTSYNPWPARDYLISW